MVLKVTWVIADHQKNLLNCYLVIQLVCDFELKLFLIILYQLLKNRVSFELISLKTPKHSIVIIAKTAMIQFMV